MSPVFGKLNFDYSCIVNSIEFILVQLLDNIVTNKITVIPDFYQPNVYNRTCFFTMVTFSRNKLFLSNKEYL